MFENVPTKQEPDDIFAAVDGGAPTPTAPSVSGIRPAPPMSISPSLPEENTHHTSPLVIGLLIVGALVILGLAGFLSYYFLSAKTPASPTPPTADEVVPRPPVTPEAPTPVKTTPEEPVTPPPVVPEVPVVTDTDKDGLTDEEEASAGTNPRLTDTDADGLYDFDELKKHNTNPLNPDTDGDTFKDGDEVKNGYNPSGPGKLLPTPTPGS